LQGLSDVSCFAQGRQTLSSRTEASLLVTVDKDRLAASFGMSGVSDVSNSSFRTKSSETFLFQQLFSNSASETILLNTSSASEVYVLWSAARRTPDLSLSARRYLCFFPISGYFVNLSMLTNESA